MSSHIQERRSGEAIPIKVDWTSPDRAHECRVLICPEDDGRFSALALRLPGVASQGDTVEEALRNITEAFQGAIETYHEEGMPIPWQNVDHERTNGCFERWILVNV